MHLVGIFADGLMVARVKKERKSAAWKKWAVIPVIIYTLAFVAWLIYVQVVRFDHLGKVCSGYYLTAGESSA